MGFFQKLLKAGADRRVRMCNLQSAKDCASVKTSLATVHALAQEMGKRVIALGVFIYLSQFRAGTCLTTWSVREASTLARHQRLGRSLERSWKEESNSLLS